MSELPPSRAPERRISPVVSAHCKTDDTAEKVLCERCAAEMYRMHAVWRCSQCGYKTDCCGW